jgi:hypothetical protein
MTQFVDYTTELHMNRYKVRQLELTVKSLQELNEELKLKADQEKPQGQLVKELEDAHQEIQLLLAKQEELVKALDEAKAQISRNSQVLPQFCDSLPMNNTDSV